MKRSVIFLPVFFLLIVNAITAQKMPSDYFEEGAKAFELKRYNDALSSFRYIVTHHPKNDLYPESFYNYGLCFYQLKQNDSAIKVFDKILKSDFNDRREMGGGIMDDPYANYRNRSSSMLSIIYEKKMLYQKALYYQSLSDTVYRYEHFCGNELAENRVNNALRYELLYKKLNRKDDAIAALLPTVFIKYVNNDKVIKDLKALLAGRKGLKKKLDEAIAAMYPKSFESGKDTYKRHYFKFLNTEIMVPGGYEDEKNPFDQQKVIAEIHETDFYKMVVSL